MDASVWVAKTGLTAQQRRMTVIANNLANVNTVAFKRDRAVDVPPFPPGTGRAARD